jgi:hypothetical protein
MTPMKRSVFQQGSAFRNNVITRNSYTGKVEVIFTNEWKFEQQNKVLRAAPCARRSALQASGA